MHPWADASAYDETGLRPGGAGDAGECRGGRVVGSQQVEPGAVLANRYVIEDLLAEEGEASSWRARDEILARSVVLQIVPSTSPCAHPLLDGAKRASRIADPRLLQVLDAVDDGVHTYVVREWASGQALSVVLAEGPLPARRAAWVVREVAAAMAKAHRAGLAHRRLAPDSVVITKSSGVKVVGLGTSAALDDCLAERDRGGSGEPADGGAPPSRVDVDGGQRQDTRDVGRLLYAALTARWPGGSLHGLPAAPIEHHRLLHPRQVRAGVPRSLDTICDRLLGDPPRYGPPLETVSDVEHALGQALNDGPLTTVSARTEVLAPLPHPGPSATETHPALLSRDSGPPTVPVPSPAGPTGRRRSGTRRAVIFATIAAAVAAVAVLAYLVGQPAERVASEDPPPTGSETQAPPAPRALAIASAASFDPPPDGSGDENPNLVRLATDDNPRTSWETLAYANNPFFGGLKRGVGLRLDLGRPQTVREVEMRLPTGPTGLQVRAAPAGSVVAPMSSVDQYDLLETRTAARGDVTVGLDDPVRTQFVLVWLTKLPPEVAGVSYRGSISEIRVLG
ncbi:MAG: hypothetical protein AVDCRST_MAG21-1530 [uncultured Nocardioidaceae bacterium]|uniref:Protein kinase domain-containing protein n=1 Tax=uncultured Nocardioidaceae bacterium TaxID=253824 RepID=A0A6J4N501_9ACTN|nr:MAG: hypothetical protein AVDCRST_MAG21-1530 [uncultured Nocardioidaceae bacterium]